MTDLFGFHTEVHHGREVLVSNREPIDREPSEHDTISIVNQMRAVMALLNIDPETAEQVLWKGPHCAKLFLAILAEPLISGPTAAKWCLNTLFQHLDVLQACDAIELLVAVESGKLTHNAAMKALTNHLGGEKMLAAIRKAALRPDATDACVKAIARNPKLVEDYTGGKEAALGRLIGVARQIGDKDLDPKDIRDTLIRLIGDQ